MIGWLLAAAVVGCLILIAAQDGSPLAKFGAVLLLAAALAIPVVATLR